jgi:DNA-binding NarL/FixJ family response regulator
MKTKPSSVLLIDDSAVVRMCLRTLFENAGFICAEAENGALAVEQAGRLKPDLIVLDFSMPMMNGLDTAPLLKEKLPQTPIIMFTSFATEGLVDLALKAGVSAVLSKDQTAHLISRAESLMNSPTG